MDLLDALNNKLIELTLWFPSKSFGSIQNFFLSIFFFVFKAKKKKARKNILRLKYVVLPIIVDSSEASHRVKSMSRARPYFQSISRFSWSLRFNYKPPVNFDGGKNVFTATKRPPVLHRPAQFVNFFACLLYAHETTKQKFCLVPFIFLPFEINDFDSFLTVSIFPWIEFFY